MADPWYFNGASHQRSADDMRRAINSGFSVFPQDTVLGNPARREQLGEASKHVVQLTAVFAVVSSVVPGAVGRALAGLVAGMEKDPGTGKLRPGTETLGNFAPSPVGFLEPKAVGLAPNWWLPAGATNYIPPVADQMGLGLPQQRKQDQEADARAFDDAWQKQVIAARRRLLNESDDTLRQIIAGPLPFTRAGSIQTTTNADPVILRLEARRELALRESGVRATTADRVGGLANSAAEARAQRVAVLDELAALGNQLDAQQAQLVAQLRAALSQPGGPLDPFATPPDGGSIQVQRIPALTGAAIRSALGALGINVELVTERIDP